MSVKIDIMINILDDILATIQTDRDNFVTIENVDKVDEQKKKTLQTELYDKSGLSHQNIYIHREEEVLRMKKEYQIMSMV